MPTTNQLIKRAEYLVDDVLDADLAIDFFNEAIADLSLVYGIEKTQTFQATSGVVTLPSDLSHIMRIYVVIDGEDEPAEMITQKEEYLYRTGFVYRMFGNDIEIFPKPKQDYTIKVDYFAKLPLLPTLENDSNLEATPQFDDRFHKALSVYCALQYAENDDNIYKINNLKESYYSVREEMEKEFQKRKYRMRKNKVQTEIGWY